MNIALVSHDSRKMELLEWAEYNEAELRKHTLYATGTTGRLLNGMFNRVNKTETVKYCEELKSGPLGGDMQIGAMIAEDKLDILIFFCDNLIQQGHQNDVSALTRLASLYNIAFATNRTTADMILTSPLLRDETYKRIIPEAINAYRNRKL